TSSVTLPDVVLAGRPPQGTNAGGPYDDFSPQASNVSVGAGASFTVTASRSFTTSDPTGTWWCYLSFETSDRVYHDGLDTTFTVGSSSGAAPPVSFAYTPSSPLTGQPVAFDGTTTVCVATPCTYSWTDDADNSRLGTGPTMSFIFQGAGTKYVRLTVTDALGNSGSVEHDVVVGSSHQRRHRRPHQRPHRRRHPHPRSHQRQRRSRRPA
ncbi:MAG: PKD domain-containing protein, partial [Chloroflexi bacterium]